MSLQLMNYFIFIVISQVFVRYNHLLFMECFGLVLRVSYEY